MQNKAINILRIESSSRIDNSYSRKLATDILGKLELQYGQINIRERDISSLPFLSEAAVEGMFTSGDLRSKEQRDALTISDQLIDELRWSNIIVIGVPIYNFNVPAALKAYLDLTVRIEETFVHTAEGSRGLINGKRALVVISSAGTKFKSKVDFASHYMEFILSFIGIKDVTLINATGIDSNEQQNVLPKVKQQIGEVLKKDTLKAVA